MSTENNNSRKLKSLLSKPPAPEINQPTSLEELPKKSTFKRKPHKKSRNGCPQCKARKVKCDEALPSCKKCLARKKHCGYLDYSKREIELIKLAHWELDGANPDEFPLQQQEYDPERRLEVLSELTSSDGASPNSLDSRNDIQLQLLGSPSEHNDEIKFLINEKEFNDHNGFGYEVYDDFNGDDDFNNNYSIKLIKHDYNPPKLNIKDYPSYFNEPIANFTTRHFIRNLLHSQILYSLNHVIMFKETLLYGIGPFLSKRSNEFESLFLRIRGECMNYILQEIGDINDDNAIYVFRTSLLLDSSSLFLKGKISFKQHFKFSIGPTSILQKVYEDTSKFPKSFSSLKPFGDLVLYTTKYVWVPQYSNKVIFEFRDIVKEFGEEFIINGNNDILKGHYDDLIAFLDVVLDLFENYKSDDLVLRYPINKLYELFQIWFEIFPSECFVIESKNYSQVEKVFYLFWFVLLKFLESVIISCRYLFTFFFDGFFLIHTFKRDNLYNVLTDDKLKWYFNYGCRVIVFFDRRMCYILCNTIFSEPIPIYLELKDRLKARPLDIHERCITSFRDTVIKKIHYPTESTTLSGFNSEQLINYYKNNTNKPLEETDLFGQLEELTATEDTDANEVDLVNNVNPKTCLLNNDYDPRNIDPIFKETVVYQEVTLEFFTRYIEDRKLIIQIASN